MGDLVAAEAGFLIDDELLDVEGEGDAVVAKLDDGDGFVGLVDLPEEGAGPGEESDDGHDHDAAEDVIEARRVHKGPPPGVYSSDW